MIFAPKNSIPSKLPEQLQVLIDLLEERKREFEAFASGIKQRSVRRSVWGLALECGQYAHELAAQLFSMGIVPRPSAVATICLNKAVLPSTDASIVHSCELSERKLLHHYSMLIRDPLVNYNLKTLLQNQMLGLEYAFAQTRLLENTLYRS